MFPNRKQRPSRLRIPALQEKRNSHFKDLQKGVHILVNQKWKTSVKVSREGVNLLLQENEEERIKLQQGERKENLQDLSDLRVGNLQKNKEVIAKLNGRVALIAVSLF